MTKQTTLHVGAPNLGSVDTFHRYATQIFSCRWLTNHGALVQELESKLALYLGVKHAIAVSSATSGIEIAAEVLSLKGEVIVPSFTFVATANALAWRGLKPVFADIEHYSHTIDPSSIASCISGETSAILGVHLWGNGCDDDMLRMLADDHGLRLFYDASHAFGCTYKGRSIGGFGELSIFSLHATKIFNTAEGGLIVTDNDDLAAKCRRIRNFGFVGLDQVQGLGINAKMSEIHAALGLVNLEEMNRFLVHNQVNYALYQLLFSKMPGLDLMEYNDNEENNYHYIVVEVGPRFPLSRDELIDVLQAHHILARRYFWPGVHRMDPYAKTDGGKRLPVTEAVADRVVVFPTGTAVGEQDIRRIESILGKVLRHKRGSFGEDGNV